ncbi:MAG: N-acetylmuramoyl-L-alanine amidase [Cyanobacteria bacterium P01_D01_bin.156]
MYWNPLSAHTNLGHRCSWLTSGLLGILGSVLVALPVDAANLQFWRFDQQQNRLSFTTDTQVRPTAQLIFNPTRLVIDLPDTQVTSSTTRQRLRSGLQEVRVGQLDDQTTRIVIELAPGYSLDPQQVQVRGETNRRWYVQLPELIRDGASRSPSTPTTTPREPERQAVESTNRVTQADTQVEGIRATADGFFIRVTGQTPEIKLSRSRPRDPERQIIFELANSSIASGLTIEDLPKDRYSVERWEITQTEAMVVITMTLGEDSPDWRMIVTDISENLRGISVLPDRVAIREIPDNPPPEEDRQISSEPNPRRPSPPSERIVRPPATSPGELPRVEQQRVVVVIDPGHGGRDPGAVGIGGLQEKQVILPISQQVADILRQQGVDVVMTRNRDFELDLEPRVQIAERADADFFVSIHANAINLSRPDVNGLETYYYSQAGARFARTVHDIVLRTMGMRDRRARQARFYVLRRTSMPAILIEVGFVTGAEDIHNLRSPEWRSDMASAIARGILIHIQREQ